VRVIACLTELPNIAHGDESSETSWARDWSRLRRSLRAGPDDELIVVWGGPEDVRTACEEIAIRAREATEGVPGDTRQPLNGGTTGFERVLPGADRMYPDTDLPPIPLSPARVERVRKGLPPAVRETERRLREAGMVEHDVQILCIAPHARLVERLILELGIDGKLVGVVLSQRWRALRRAGLVPERLGRDALLAIFSAHAEGRLERSGIRRVILELLLRPGRGRLGAAQARAAIEAFPPAGAEEIATVIDAVMQERSKEEFRTPEARREFLMGELQRRLGGRVPGRRLALLLQERLDP